MKNLVFGLIATVFMINLSWCQEYANQKNPFDNVGKQHNEIVNEFLSKYGSQKLSVEKTLELISGICKTKKIEGKGLTKAEFDNGIIDIKINFRETVSNSSLSKEGKGFLQKLFDYMLNNGFNGTVDYKECHAYILNFENDILENKTMSNSDKEFLLKSTSVGRHSINLWHKRFSDENNENNAGRRRGWFSWLIVGAADICGGVAGGGAFSVPGAIGASTATVGFLEANDK